MKSKLVIYYKVCPFQKISTYLSTLSMTQVVPRIVKNWHSGERTVVDKHWFEIVAVALASTEASVTCGNNDIPHLITSPRNYSQKKKLI